MELLSNFQNDIYNHVAFLHKRSRVNSISLSFFVLLLTLSVLALHFRPNWKRCQLVRNFLGKFPKNPLNCLNSEMKTISPKLLGILAVKSNRIRIPSRNVLKKKIWVKLAFQEIPEYAVPLATGNFRFLQSDGKLPLFTQIFENFCSISSSSPQFQLMHGVYFGNLAMFGFLGIVSWNIPYHLLPPFQKSSTFR